MKRFVTICGTLTLSLASAAGAQGIPAEYQQVLTALGKTGDYKANVLKVNIPRNDVSVTVANVKTPTPFGFGGWVAMTKGTGGMDVMMGDLVLTQDEVNPVMKKLEEGLDFLQRNEEKLWFWGVDRAEDLGFSAEFLKEAGLKLDRRQEFPHKAASLSVVPERDVPAFSIGPMRRGLAELIEEPRAMAAGD